MRKYKKQGSAIIAELQKKIEIVELADKIIEARLTNGIDRVPMDIHSVIHKIETMKRFDNASIYCLLVSHTDSKLNPIVKAV